MPSTGDPSMPSRPDFTTPATRLVQPSAFCLDRLRRFHPDGPRDERLEFLIPSRFWFTLDEIRLAAGPTKTITDVVVYGLRQGRRWFERLPSVVGITEAYHVLIANGRGTLLYQLPSGAYRLPDSHQRLQLRGVREHDGASAARHAVHVGLAQGEILQAWLVAGLVGGPIQDAVYQQDLVQHLRDFEGYLRWRHAMLADRVSRVKGVTLVVGCEA